MTSDKVYRKKQCPLKVLEIMQRDYMALFDYHYLSLFIDKMANYYTGEIVTLNNLKIRYNNKNRYK